MAPPNRRRRRIPSTTQSSATPLADTQLSVRTVNALERLGVFTVGDLLRRNQQQLMDSQNFGDKTMRELIDLLDAIGLALPAGWERVRRRHRSK